MPRIKQLSKQLINQIAAGEVIERPVSVVKELVENSIDAGSTKISIEVTNDCKNLRIADNGCGIHPDDIILAFSKHATSKIQNSDDLFKINTLGFRGEALSSIISIAKVSCTTRTKDFEYGTKVVCENSEVNKSKTGCAIGTIIDVQNLFYNLPARLKFLRNSKTEMSHIQELMQSVALINSNISFELKNNGKTVLKTTGSNDSIKTIKEIFSDDVTNNLKEVLKTDKLSGLKISGFVSTPDLTRSSKKNYHIYINSRTVKCPVIQKSIDTAYKNTLSNGKYPFVLLNLEIPFSDVDVNVHPTKKEVRYKNANQIFSLIYSAIDMALTNNSFNVEKNLDFQHKTPEPQNYNNFSTKTNFRQKDRENDNIYVSDEEINKNTLFSSAMDFYAQLDNTCEKQANQSPSEIQPELDEENIIGQYKNTYILIEKENGLEIVDQHIAEERFIYEKLKKQKEPASQMIFISDVLEVSASEAENIKQYKEKIEKFGYGIEFLKDTQLIFKKVPQLLSKISPKELLSDIIDNLSGNLDGLEEKILIMTSCKAAVKAGQKLNLYQMQEIIKNWRRCEKPYTCPHGRPISKIVEHKKIAAFFERNE